MPGPLLAFDAPSLLYRAFFALPDSIEGADGEPVNALLGSTNIVLRVIEDEAPRAVVACFGPDAAPYRVELYAGYHAARPPMPDGLALQWPRSKDLFAALGWTVDHDDTVEADDLLHSHALTEAEAGGRALILTGDRDLYQCASESVDILYVRTGRAGPERVDPAEVKKRYRVAPEQVPDFIALRGDPSDGLPGARGIGEKTAADLLYRHGSLEATLADAKRATTGERPRIAQALRDQADELRDFKEIATLRRVDVERPPDRPLDRAGGAAAARRLGMERLAERLEHGAGTSARTSASATE